MKKVIHFSKLFIPFAILSVLIIAGGIAVALTRGINFGIDFKPGLVQEVRIVPPAISLTYTGAASVAVQTSASGVTVVVSGAGADNTTHNFYYGQNPTVADLTAALNTVNGVSATALVSPTTPSLGMFTDSEVDAVLSSTPFSLFREQETTVTVDAVRNALTSVEGASVKATGEAETAGFQIRVGDDGTDKEVSNTIKRKISSALAQAFGKENIAVVKTDFVGAGFSKSLATSSLVLVFLTLGCIWVYASIRFKWDLALGAVIAIIHDALIMVAMFAFTQMEFTTLTIAAILTVVGYSINDTIVVYDRLRENIRTLNIKSIKDLIDITQTEVLSRTVITTITTLLVVLALYIVTPGSMKDFAFALLIGMISGVYSTIFIASSFVCACRKNWKPTDEVTQPVTLSAN